MAKDKNPKNADDPKETEKTENAVESNGSQKPDKKKTLIQKNMRTGLMVLGAVVLMIGIAFASVPLYDLFCRVTGFGGTTRVAAGEAPTILDRKVTVRFNADIARDMNWTFKSEIPGVQIRLGEKGFVTFRADNLSEEIITGTAIYNVTPPKAGKYFNKVQCFCFQEQMLQPHQTTNFPVLFYVDPKMNDDPDMQDVDTITLSYTFFKSDSKALEDTMQASYNESSSEDTNATDQKE